MRAALSLLCAHLRRHVHAGEVQQRVLVIRSVIRLDLVVVACNAIEAGIDDWLDGILLREQCLTFVQGFLGGWKVTEEELGVGDGGEGEGVSFGDGAGRGGLSRAGLGGFDGVGRGEAGVD